MLFITCVASEYSLHCVQKNPMGSENLVSVCVGWSMTKVLDKGGYMNNPNCLLETKCWPMN